MLSDTKILVTGVTGRVAKPIAEPLAVNNDLWGIARFHVSLRVGTSRRKESAAR